MLVTQSDTIDIPTSLGTVLQIRDNNSFQRTLYFRNLTLNNLSAQIEASADGGTTWTIIDTSFTIGAIGSGTEVIVKNISSAYASSILRVRASGGGSDRDLNVAYVREYLDTNYVWGSPVI